MKAIQSRSLAGIRCMEAKGTLLSELEAMCAVSRGPGGRGECGMPVGSECESLREHKAGNEDQV